MPRPHTASPVRPAQYFGIGGLPVNEYFDPPRNGFLDPSFSPIARESMLQEEAKSRELERQAYAWQAEDAARDLMNRSPGLTSDQLMQELTPEVLSSPQGEAFQQFANIQLQRERLANYNTKYTNATLGPQLALKLADNPRVQQEFMRRVEAGEPALDAFNQAKEMASEESELMKLAESGVPEEKFEAYRGADGRIDKVKVARAVAEYKARPKLQTISPSELITIQDRVNKEPEMAPAFLLNLESQGYDTSGIVIPNARRMRDLTPDQLLRYQNAASLWEDDQKKTMSDALYQSGYNAQPLFGFPPPNAPKDEPSVPGSVQEPAPAEPIKPILPEEELPPTLEEMEEANVQADSINAEDQEIASAWTQAKLDLQNRLIEALGSEEKVLAAARAIAAGRTIEVPTLPGSENNSIALPYGMHILRRAGITSDDVAFNEPRNKRTGSQEVSYSELIRAWAQEVADRERAQKLSEATQAVKPGQAVRGRLGSIITIE